MSSLHSTLTTLIDSLVRDILRAVRESSLQDVVSAAPPANRKRTPAPQAQRPPRRAARSKEATKRGAPKKSVLLARRASAKRRPAAGRAPSAIEDMQTGYGEVQITDPEALLREAAATVAPPRPSPAEVTAVADTVEPLTTPTLREGEDILRTASGRTVLRRRRAL